jgi:hypothetical protein
MMAPRVSFYTLLIGAILLAPVAADADVRLIKGPSGNACFNPECLGTTTVPALQGVTTDYTLVGFATNDIRRSAQAPTSSGVTITFDTPFADLTPNPFALGANSSIRMRIAVAPDATPGERTISLRNNENQSLNMSVKIVVVRKGRVTSISTSRQSNYFTQALVTVRGTNLTNSSVDVDFPGNTPSSVTVNGDGTEAQVTIGFLSPQSMVTGKVRLWDYGCRSCGIYPRYFHTGTDAGNLGWSSVTIIGPNGLKQISVASPDGARFSVGKSATITIMLVRPVDQITSGDRVSTGTTVGRTLGTLATASSGLTVQWNMDPEHAVPASGQVTFPPGTDTAKVTLTNIKLKYLAGNSSYTIPPTLRVEARIAGTTGTAPPSYLAATFPTKQ